MSPTRRAMVGVLVVTSSLAGSVKALAQAVPAGDSWDHVDARSPRRAASTEDDTVVVVRRRPALAIIGTSAFVLTYIGTVGIASVFGAANSNAAREAYIPLAGPLMARSRLPDAWVGDWGAFMILDSVLQIGTLALAVTGVIIWRVGTREVVHVRRPGSGWTSPPLSVRPMFAAVPGTALTGLEVVW